MQIMPAGLSWILVDLTFLGELDPGDQTQVVPIMSGTFSSGDFYVISKDGENSNLVNNVASFKKGDWIVSDGNVFRKN